MCPILGIAFLASIFLFSLPSISLIASVPSSPVPKFSVNQTSLINGTNLKKILKAKCLTNNDCWNSELGNHSTCRWQTCTCNFGYTTHYSQKLCSIIVCTYNDECTYDFFGSLCDRTISRCVCEPGYAVNKNTAQCETSTASILLMVYGPVGGVLGIALICSCLVGLYTMYHYVGKRKQMIRRGKLIGPAIDYPYSQHFTSLTFSHLWILSDFTNLYKESCQWKWQLESEYFSPPDLPLQLSLVLWPMNQPKGICGEIDEETAIGFEMCSWTVPTCLEGKLTLREKRWIVDEEGRQLFGKEYVDWVLYANTHSSDSAFLPVKQLLDPENGYLHNGKLTILSEITLHCSTAIFPKVASANLSTRTHTTVPLSVTCFSHRFTLEHFKWMSEKRTLPLCIESADFADNQGVELDEGAVGNLRIAVWPNGNDGLGDDAVCIGVRNRNQDSVLVHFKLRILDIEEEEDRGEKEVQVFYKVERTVRINAQAGRAFPISRRNFFELTDEQVRDQLTVECRVQVLYPNTPIIQTATHSLRMPKKTFSSINLGLFNFHAVTFTWPIEQFTSITSSATTESGPYLDSKLFSPLTDTRYRFQLRFYPAVGNREEKETEANEAEEAEETREEGDEPKSEQVMLKLRYLSLENETEETTVQWIVTLQDASGNEWTRIEQTQRIYKDVDFDLQQLLSRPQLNNFWRFLLPNNTLTLQIQLWIHEKRSQLPSELLNQPSGSSPFGTGLQIVHSQLQSVVIVNHSTSAADSIILGNGSSPVSQPETLSK